MGLAIRSRSSSACVLSAISLPLAARRCAHCRRACCCGLADRGWPTKTTHDVGRFLPAQQAAPRRPRHRPQGPLPCPLIARSEARPRKASEQHSKATATARAPTAALGNSAKVGSPHAAGRQSAALAAAGQRGGPRREPGTLPLTLLTGLFITVPDADRGPLAGKVGAGGRSVTAAKNLRKIRSIEVR
jgi:hypothetical protein